jgi:hypothetical protein
LLASLAGFASAAAAGHGLYNLDIVIGTGVPDKMADVDDALETGVGAS